MNELAFNEIRWDHENDKSLLLREKFENIARLIEEKMKGQSGLVWLSEHNYLLFAASTTSNFSHDPRIKFSNGRYWLVVRNAMLAKDEIRVYPDSF